MAMRTVLFTAGGRSAFFCAMTGRFAVEPAYANYPLFNQAGEKGLDMVPTLALREKAMQLLAADTATLAPAANAKKIALVKVDFPPAETLVFADLDLADFDGSTPLDLGLGTQAEGLNPGTTDAVIDLKLPAGGLRWETTGLTNLPQTIYGWALLDNAGTLLMASGIFEDPITLTAVNERVDVTQAKITQQANSMF